MQSDQELHYQVIYVNESLFYILAEIIASDQTMLMHSLIGATLSA